MWRPRLGQERWGSSPLALLDCSLYQKAAPPRPQEDTQAALWRHHPGEEIRRRTNGPCAWHEGDPLQKQSSGPGPVESSKNCVPTTSQLQPHEGPSANTRSQAQKWEALINIYYQVTTFWGNVLLIQREILIRDGSDNDSNSRSLAEEMQNQT